MIEGIGVSKGFGIGRLFRYETGFEIPKFRITNIDEELLRFCRCVEIAIKDLEVLYEKSKLTLGLDKADVFHAHILILKDPEFIGKTEALIKDGTNAEHAVKVTSQVFENMFLAMDSDYFKERAADVKDISTRVIKLLLGLESINLNEVPKGSILYATDLTPSDTAQLQRENIAGIITELGGQTSHSAIIARSLGIPAVMGIENIEASGQVVIVDGEAGLVMTSPNKDMIAIYEQKIEERKAYEERLKIYLDKTFIDSSGRKIEIAGNIASPDESAMVLENGGQGVGLFRSEFIYMNRGDAPSEEEQYEAYKQAVIGLKGHPMTIRTMDIGGDKEVDYIQIEKELNPFLGYRAIRYCFDHIDFFKTQLRALYRASIHGKLRIMFPMVSRLQEIQRIKEIIEEVKFELRTDKISFAEDVEIGIMIEVPSAAIMSDILAKEVDFASIGTNDLTQYTLASDRMNGKVRDIYSNFDPSVIRLINMTIENFHREGKWVGMCGSAAGNVRLAPLFYAMGLDEYSMPVNSILELKETLSGLNAENTKDMLEDVLKLGTKDGVEQYLEAFRLAHGHH